jgi:DNA modification methylase
MPELTWPGKQLQELPRAGTVVDSIIFPDGRGYPSASVQNRLICGDNLGVMTALLPEYEGRINLIYADPPFFTNRKFHARIGRGEDSRKPEKWKLAEGYPDAWPNIHDYLDFIYQRFTLFYRMLAENGTLYLHLDWHADSYARLLLDEIFGQENLLNEVIWTYHGPSPIRRAFNRKHDTILVYVKSPDYIFNPDSVREPYHPSTVKTFKSSAKAGFGKIPNLVRGKVPEDWWYFPVVARMHSERTGYPTQKPEALLERIILASSNAGDIVADFFCGSGTTPTVADRLGRTFIACDSAWRAIHTTRSRVLSTTIKPFTLERSTEVNRPMHSSKNLQISRINSTLKVSPGNLKLDYWEVDPDWNGNIFMSAAQALRPRRFGEISEELNIKTSRKACVRLVTEQGKDFQLNI